MLRATALFLCALRLLAAAPYPTAPASLSSLLPADTLDDAVLMDVDGTETPPRDVEDFLDEYDELFPSKRAEAEDGRSYRRRSTDSSAQIEGKDTNFIRLGRGKADNFIRFGRAGKDNFLRFGRGKPENFIRFGRNGDEEEVMDNIVDLEDDGLSRATRAGKPDNFIRFGRDKSSNFLRFGRPNNFMRFGRGPSDGNVIRFGRSKPSNNFMRFGREPDDSFARPERSGKGQSQHFGRGKLADRNFIRLGRSGDYDNLIRFGRDVNEVLEMNRTKRSLDPDVRFYSPLAMGLPNFLLGPELSILPPGDETSMAKRANNGGSNFIRLG